MEQEDTDQFVPNGRLTSDYGWRDLDNDGVEEDYHEGVDIGPPEPGQEGVDVHAGVNGEVTFVGGDYGTVAVETEDGQRVRYLHLADINVEVGDTVNGETIVGEMGGTGPEGADQYSIHLHLDLQDPDANWEDPQEQEWDMGDAEFPPDEPFPTSS